MNAARRAQNRDRVRRHRARTEDGIGVILVEFDLEALALFLDRTVPRVGRPYKGDDRADLGAGIREWLIQSIARS